MKTRIGGDASSVLQSAKHTVFVEGSNDEEIDPVVIRELLRINDLAQIDVKPMGHCYNVRSAVQALIRHHPSYYFLIDRDDQEEDAAERSWSDFPNPDTHNVIIWRKRELGADAEQARADAEQERAAKDEALAETEWLKRLLADKPEPSVPVTG